MSQTLATTAATLKAEFDRSFAAPAGGLDDRGLDFLALGFGNQRWAVALAEVAELHQERKIVPLPTGIPELLGLAAFRGALAPVWDLGQLLGQPKVERHEGLLLVRSPTLVALAFERFEAHLRIDRDRISADAITTHDGPRALIKVASVLEAIGRRVDPGAPRGEG
jgi:chemotaxis signal transduction protein